MLQKLFGFVPSSMTVKREVIAGITTFLTMAYILAVNPSILSDAGMDKGAVFTATVISSVLATLVMAMYAKLPFALAPGMGLNAFFAYTVVLTMGYSWQFALTAVFIEGIIFILLTLTGLRQKIVDSMPLVLRRAISPGIGFFIAFIGLKNAGIVSASPATFVTMGNLHDPAVLLAAFGILLSAVLLIKKVTGALLIGILVTTVIGIPLGVTHFSSVLDVPPSIAPIVMKFEWHNVLSFDMAICVLTFLFIDMFDTIGTLLGVSHRAGMVDEKGNIPHLTEAFMADAIGTAAGAMLGTSTVTTYVESASGVNAGGRSGLTSFTTAICFVLALFLAPLFLAIPAQATAPALVLVGVMMMTDVSKLHLGDFADAVPAFVCIALMPLTYSISDGILMGLITYVLLRIFAGRYRELKLGMIVLAVLFVLKYAFL
ncbi:MAG: NCS2 family permease [Bacteroidaceae bacterium]|nr:NCS2 family permease [Bacteroidaceae bacterium]MEE1241183.1 NCS2 family permease [Bacteroidaceae bacterium]